MSDRGAIVSALEALGVGNAREAEAILLGVLEDGPVEHRVCCDQCPWTGQWPGELDDHRRIAHWEAA